MKGHSCCLVVMLSSGGRWKKRGSQGSEIKQMQPYERFTLLYCYSWMSNCYFSTLEIKHPNLRWQCESTPFILRMERRREWTRVRAHSTQPQLATQFSFDEMYKPLQHRETACLLVRLVQVSSGHILDIFLNLRLQFFRDVIVDVGPRRFYL